MKDKEFYNKVKKNAVKWNLLKLKFDQWVESKYGFHYSDKDIDEIIDCIDYGNDGIDYDRFDKLMSSKKECDSE